MSTERKGIYWLITLALLILGACLSYLAWHEGYAGHGFDKRPKVEVKVR